MLSGDLRQNHVGVGTRLAGVVQGYRPQVDWGGDSGSATIVVGGHNVRLATSGWRRRCLYTLLLALLALSVINLSLTLWILKTVHFNMDGMGHLFVVRGGLTMHGASKFNSKLSVARILSRVGENLPINGYYNLTFHTSEFNTSPEDEMDANSTVDDLALSNQHSYLHLNVDDMLSGTKQFIVRDSSGKELFHADGHGTRVGADKFTVTGFGGAEFAGSMQTPRIDSKGVHGLGLDSVTRDIKIRSKDELRVLARNGDISSICTGNFAMIAKEGAIRFDNPAIYIPILDIEGEEHMHNTSTEVEGQPAPTLSPTETQIPPPPLLNRAPIFPKARSTGPTTPMPTPAEGAAAAEENGEGIIAPEDVQVFQVCVCPNGRLFAVAAAYACVQDDAVCR